MSYHKCTKEEKILSIIALGSMIFSFIAYIFIYLHIDENPSFVRWLISGTLFGMSGYLFIFGVPIIVYSKYKEDILNKYGAFIMLIIYYVICGCIFYYIPISKGGLIFTVIPSFFITILGGGHDPEGWH